MKYTAHLGLLSSAEAYSGANTFTLTARNSTEQQCKVVTDVVLPEAEHLAALDIVREEQMVQT